MLSGAYTNSGTFGVATSYFKQLNLGTDQAATLASLTALAYAVTYPFGTAGAAWFLGTLAPRMLKIDLAASCKELEKTIGVHRSDPDVTPWYRAVLTRAYRVSGQSVIGRKASELGNIIGCPDAFVRRIRQDGVIMETDGGTVIQDGATLAIAGDRKTQLAAGRLVGAEVDDVELLSFPVEQLDVIVTDRMAAACTVQELQDVVMARTGHRIFIAGLSRSGREVGFSPATQLEVHDVLTLVGAHADVEKAARFLGYADRAGTSSDIAFMSIAVALGGLLGAITLRRGGIPLSLSPGVGVLETRLICEQLRSV